MVLSLPVLYIETACAAALAGLIKVTSAGGIDEGSIVVSTMTGHGLKDPDSAVTYANSEAKLVEADLEAVKAAMGV